MKLFSSASSSLLVLCLTLGFLSSCGKKTTNKPMVKTFKVTSPNPNDADNDNTNNSGNSSSSDETNDSAQTDLEISIANLIEQNDLGVLKVRLDQLKEDHPTLIAGSKESALYLAIKHRRIAIITALFDQFVTADYIKQHQLFLDEEIKLLISQNDLVNIKALLNILESLNPPNSTDDSSSLTPGIESPSSLVRFGLYSIRDEALALLLVYLAPQFAALELMVMIEQQVRGEEGFYLTKKILNLKRQHTLLSFQFDRMIRNGELIPLRFAVRHGKAIKRFLSGRIFNLIVTNSATNQEKSEMIGYLASLYPSPEKLYEDLGISLFHAILHNKDTLIEQFVFLGVNLNSVLNSDGLSPIAYAATIFNLEVIELLKTNGATTDVTLHEYRRNGTVTTNQVSFCFAYGSRGFYFRHVTNENYESYLKILTAMHCY